MNAAHAAPAEEIAERIGASRGGLQRKGPSIMLKKLICEFQSPHCYCSAFQNVPLATRAPTDVKVRCQKQEAAQEALGIAQMQERVETQPRHNPERKGKGRDGLPRKNRVLSSCPEWGTEDRNKSKGALKFQTWMPKVWLLMKVGNLKEVNMGAILVLNTFHQNAKLS